MTKQDWLARQKLIELYAKEDVTEEMLFGTMSPKPGQDELRQENRPRPPATPMPSSGVPMTR